MMRLQEHEKPGLTSMCQLQGLFKFQAYLGRKVASELSNYILFTSLILTFSVAPALAADKPAATKGAAKKTTINFEDQLVEGATQKPELFYLLQQRNNNFKRLIRLRENFIPEMRKSSEDVGRPTGKGIDD